MSRDLISQEAAAQMLMEKSYSYVVSLFPTSDECKTAREIAKACAEAVRQMEAVDAEPVRHSHWHYHGDGHFFCCGCKKYIVCIGGDADLNYCPNCGAIMDEEEEWLWR